MDRGDGAGGGGGGAGGAGGAGGGGGASSPTPPLSPPTSSSRPRRINRSDVALAATAAAAVAVAATANTYSNPVVQKLSAKKIQRAYRRHIARLRQREYDPDSRSVGSNDHSVENRWSARRGSNDSVDTHRQDVFPFPRPQSNASNKVSLEDTRKPYISITDISAKLDSGFDRYIEDSTNAATLKEVSIKGENGSVISKPSQSRFIPIDGDFPKMDVKIYEHMIYHSNNSLKLNPLEIFVPIKYKIDHNKINQYLSSKNDLLTQNIKKMVIESFGENPNALYYKHTIIGKNGGKNVGDMDEKSQKEIQFIIDNWHEEYTERTFYDNASKFFLQNKPLDKFDLITLEKGVEEVFSVEGLMKLVDDNATLHNKINEIYEGNTDAETNNVTKTVNNLSLYYRLFNVVYADIKKHITDPLNYISERSQHMGYEYKFNEVLKNEMFQTYTEIKSSLDSFDLSGGKIPYLSIINVINKFKAQITGKNEKLRQSFSVFDKFIKENTNTYEDGYNRRYDRRDRSSYKYYKTYALVEYIYYLFSTKDSNTPDPFKTPNDIADMDPLTLYGKLDNITDEHNNLYERKYVDGPPRDPGEKVKYYRENDETDLKHILRQIEYYKQQSIIDGAEFISQITNTWKFNLKTSFDAKFEGLELPFGVDLLFYVLYIATISITRFISDNQADLDKIDETKNIELRKLRLETTLDENKLKDMCDIIANYGGFKTEQILPDRKKYIYPESPDPKLRGMVNDNLYKDEWEKKIVVDAHDQVPDDKKIATNIRFTTKKMTKKIRSVLGLSDGDTGNTSEDEKKIYSELNRLISFNTIQVMNMLFVKPRVIWYSPDLRTNFISDSSLWSSFQLKNTEVVSKRSFEEFKKLFDDAKIKSIYYPSPESDADADAESEGLSRRGSGASDTSVLEELPDDEQPIGPISLEDMPSKFCIFLISSDVQPKVQSRDPKYKKDSSDPEFNNNVFTEVYDSAQGGVIGDKPTFTGAIAKKINELVPGFKKPTIDSCANERQQIADAASDLNRSFVNSMKSIGLDMSKKLDDFQTKSEATMASAAISAHIDQLDIQKQELQRYIDETEEKYIKNKDGFVIFTNREKIIGRIELVYIKRAGEYVKAVTKKVLSDTENLDKITGTDIDKGKLTEQVKILKTREIEIAIQAVTLQFQKIRLEYYSDQKLGDFIKELKKLKEGVKLLNEKVGEYGLSGEPVYEKVKRIEELIGKTRRDEIIKLIDIKNRYIDTFNHQDSYIGTIYQELTGDPKEFQKKRSDEQKEIIKEHRAKIKDADDILKDIDKLNLGMLEQKRIDYLNSDLDTEYEYDPEYKHKLSPSVKDDVQKLKTDLEFQHFTLQYQGICLDFFKSPPVLRIPELDDLLVLTKSNEGLHKSITAHKKLQETKLDEIKDKKTQVTKAAAEAAAAAAAAAVVVAAKAAAAAKMRRGDIIPAPPVSDTEKVNSLNQILDHCVDKIFTRFDIPTRIPLPTEEKWKQIIPIMKTHITLKLQELLNYFNNRENVEKIVKILAPSTFPSFVKFDINIAKDKLTKIKVDLEKNPNYENCKDLKFKKTLQDLIRDIGILLSKNPNYDNYVDKEVKDIMNTFNGSLRKKLITLYFPLVPTENTKDVNQVVANEFSDFYETTFIKRYFQDYKQEQVFELLQFKSINKRFDELTKKYRECIENQKKANAAKEAAKKAADFASAVTALLQFFEQQAAAAASRAAEAAPPPQAAILSRSSSNHCATHHHHQLPLLRRRGLTHMQPSGNV